LSIAGQAAGLKLARTAWYGTLYTWYAKHRPATLFRGNWRDSEPLRVFASRNDPGTQLATCLMLFAQGEADMTIPPALAVALDT
jgi:hypothetical protein